MINSVDYSTEYKELMPIKDLLKDDTDVYKLVADTYEKRRIEETLYKAVEDFINRLRKQNEEHWFMYLPTDGLMKQFDSGFKEAYRKALELTKKTPVKFKYKPIITENTKEVTGILFGTVHPEYKIYNKVRCKHFVTHFNEPYYKY